jgi:hypothetical protein
LAAFFSNGRASRRGGFCARFGLVERAGLGRLVFFARLLVFFCFDAVAKSGAASQSNRSRLNPINYPTSKLVVGVVEAAVEAVEVGAAVVA